MSKSRDVEYGAALALAVSRDQANSEPLAMDLEQRFPEDTCVRFTYLPIYRAVLALNHNDPSTALAQLQTSVPYDLAVPCSWYGFFGYLYAPYVRGEAYLAAHRYTEAIAEFQKLLDHPGIVFVDPVRVPASLRLARALTLSGNVSRGRAVYQDFLTLWKDADPDIPILKRAKSDYATLQ